MPLMLGMWPASGASSVSGNLRTRSPGRKEPTFPLPPFLGWAGIILVLGFAQCVPHLPQLHICWLGAAQHVCQALWKMGRWDPACGFTQPLHPLGHTLPGTWLLGGQFRWGPSLQLGSTSCCPSWGLATGACGHLSALMSFPFMFLP